MYRFIRCVSQHVPQSFLLSSYFCLSCPLSTDVRVPTIISNTTTTATAATVAAATTAAATTAMEVGAAVEVHEFFL